MGTLLVESDRDGCVFEIPDGKEFLVGRGRQNDLQLCVGAISHTHCRFRNEGGVCTIEDLESRNLTYLNGASMPVREPRPIRPGDAIGLPRMMIFVEQIGTNRLSEEDWLSTERYFGMLNHLGDGPNARKFWLLSAECCRVLNKWDRSVELSEAIDRFADGVSTPKEAKEAEESLRQLTTLDWVDRNARKMAWMCAFQVQANNRDRSSECSAGNVMADLIRDLFGNPFRPVAVEPSWLSWNQETVLRIAQRIYAEKAFEQLPILGDALMEAGCEDEDIISHCHAKTPHVRGCWVVDLILGRHCWATRS